jgi:site-specific recombinase XerD
MAAATSRTRRWGMVKQDSIELTALIKHFELFNRTEGKSPMTIDWYNMVLRQFHRFLQEKSKSTSLADLDEIAVREFIAHLQQKRRWENNPHVPRTDTGLTPMTIQDYVRAVRVFFNWLFREGYTSENRLAKLKPPKATIKVVEVLTSEEVAKILKCIDPSTPMGARDYAIMVLLLDSGLRCSELAGFAVDDIDIEGGRVKILGKGRKERIVPFGATAQRALLRYALHFRPQPFNGIDNNFFLTPEGRQLTYEGIRMIFRRIAQRSGVKRLHAHLCRHTFATNYLINGGDVFSLQQILGHSTLEMVRRYVSLASVHVTVQHKKFSPMDRMNLRTFRSAAAKRSVNVS